MSKSLNHKSIRATLLEESRYTHMALLCSVFLFATVLRLYHLGTQPLWLDEILQLLRSTKVSFKEILISVRNEIAAAPLDYFIQHLFVKWGGHSEFVVRLHAASFGILSIVLLYAIAKLLFEVKSYF